MTPEPDGALAPHTPRADTHSEHPTEAQQEAFQDALFAWSFSDRNRRHKPSAAEGFRDGWVAALASQHLVPEGWREALTGALKLADDMAESIGASLSDCPGDPSVCGEWLCSQPGGCVVKRAAPYRALLASPSPPSGGG
jgi:hypothetical protein